MKNNKPSLKVIRSNSSGKTNQKHNKIIVEDGDNSIEVDNNIIQKECHHGHCSEYDECVEELQKGHIYCEFLYNLVTQGESYREIWKKGLDIKENLSKCLYECKEENCGKQFKGFEFLSNYKGERVCPYCGSNNYKVISEE
ncbi:MAG: hypothetical protein PHT02_01120 [Tissierellia bacterium]|nr:hypothetical protein [Tissierellia bacterium]